jgi:hypothetical protein
MSNVVIDNVRAKTFTGNRYQSGSLPDGSESDLTLYAPAGKQVVVASDLNVLGNLVMSGLVDSSGASTWLAALFIQPNKTTNLVLRPGAAGSIVLDGSVTITGPVSYADSIKNYNNQLIVNDDSAVSLGAPITDPDGLSSNIDINGSGVLLRGIEYPDDPQALSITWQNVTTAIPVPYWKLNGGNLMISRKIDTLTFSYMLAVDEFGQLAIQRVNADQSIESVAILVPLNM